MNNVRAEIGRDIQPNTRFLKEREAAFSELLEIFTNITAGKEFVNRLPDAAKKYSQFLSVSDREPLLKAVDDWNKNFLVPHEKNIAWAKILSVVMSSGANRCDVKSPGINEVNRLIPLSPFKNNDIIAHVTALAIISPNEVLQPLAHHEDYLKVRRLIYEVVAGRSGANLCLGAEYFVAGHIRLADDAAPMRWKADNPYVVEVVKPIDRRG